MMRLNWTLLLWWCLLCVVILAKHAPLQDDRYQRVVVAIAEEIDTITPKDCESLLQVLKDAFSNSSSLLLKSTGGHASFETITILVPPSWKQGETCNTTFEYPEFWTNWDDADFKLVNGNPMASNWPWTKQYGLCGEPADGVYMPLGLFTNTKRSASQLGKILVHEWAKHRYGVYDEIGFDGDGFYPPMYNNPYRECSLTSCMDVSNAVSNITCDRAQELMIPNYFENATSSLLLPSTLPSIIHFCTNDTHVPEAPTKHNLLCMGSSTWEVVQSHSDFSWKRQNPIPEMQSTAPDFRVVQQRDPGYILMLEVSDAMKDYYRDIKIALMEFSLYISDKSFVSVVIFGQNGSNLLLSPVPMTNKNRLQNLYLAITEYDKQHIELSNCSLSHCGWKTAKNIINSEDLFLQWQLILVTVSFPDILVLRQVKDDIQEQGSPIRTITFQSADSSLLVLAEVGDFYAIPNASLKSAIFMADLLIDVVNKVEHRFTIKEKNIVVYETEGTLYIPSIGRSFFLFAIYDLLVLHLHTPLHDNCIITPVFVENITMCYTGLIDSKCAFQAGNWTYDMNVGGDIRNQGVFFDLRYELTGMDYRKIPVITVRGWTDKKSATSPANPLQFPTILYAEVVDRLGRPLSNVTVEALVFRPNEHVRTAEILLIDDGSGVPDITAGDGIYSAYFDKFNYRGYYYVQIKATSKDRAAFMTSAIRSEQKNVSDMWTPCCGSRVQFNETRRIPDFEILSPGLTFYLDKDIDTDVYPPSRVADLRITSFPRKNLQLEWSIPGGNYTTGFAFKYTVLCGSEPRNLSTSQCPLKGPLVAEYTPHARLQNISLQIERAASNGVGLIYYVCVRSLDEASNQSPISNTVTFLLEYPSTTPFHTSWVTTRNTSNYTRPSPRKYNFTTTTTTTTTTAIPIVFNTTTSKPVGVSLTLAQICYIIGGVGAFLTLLLVIILIFCYCMKRAKETRDKPRYNVYISNAYLQDDDGSLRIVSDNGQIIHAERQRQGEPDLLPEYSQTSATPSVPVVSPVNNSVELRRNRPRPVTPPRVAQINPMVAMLPQHTNITSPQTRPSISDESSDDVDDISDSSGQKYPDWKSEHSLRSHPSTSTFRSYTRNRDRTLPIRNPIVMNDYDQPKDARTQHNPVYSQPTVPPRSFPVMKNLARTGINPNDVTVRTMSYV